jgi:hypothetical protein
MSPRCRFGSETQPVPVDTYLMARSRASACVRVGVTNARLGADKRGIAVELAQRVARASNAPVCLVGADPTDRDVERRMPHLIETAGDYAHSQITRGPHALDITFMPELRVCAVSVSDRSVLADVLPDLRERFRYIVIDAPSRVGYGVGIAHRLLEHLDAMLVASGPSAGDLAVTRGYLAALEQHGHAGRVDIRVLFSGRPAESELSPEQLEQRMIALPTIGRIPHLWGRTHGRPEPEELDEAFSPMVAWIVDQYDRMTAEPDDAVDVPTRDDARTALQSARAAAAYRRSDRT